MGPERGLPIKKAGKQGSTLSMLKQSHIGDFVTSINVDWSALATEDLPLLEHPFSHTMNTMNWLDGLPLVCYSDPAA